MWKLAVLCCCIVKRVKPCPLSQVGISLKFHQFKCKWRLSTNINRTRGSQHGPSRTGMFILLVFTGVTWQYSWLTGWAHDNTYQNTKYRSVYHTFFSNLSKLEVFKGSGTNILWEQSVSPDQDNYCRSKSD